MLIKVFTKNKEEKIELTTDEIQSILNEAYWEGYYQGEKSKSTITLTSPNWWNQPYYTITATASNISIKSPEYDTCQCTNKD